MDPHTVLIGCGDTGRVAAEAFSSGRPRTRLVVVDTDPEVLLRADSGVTAVLGDGSDVRTLRTAQVHAAAQVIIAVANDATAIRITAAVRGVNRMARVITLLREPLWRELAECLGADRVVVGAQNVDRLLGRSALRLSYAARDQQLMMHKLEPVVAERAVREAEVGLPASECGPLVLAVVRHGARRWRDDPQLTPLCRDDRLLVLRAFTPDTLCRWPT